MLTVRQFEHLKELKAEFDRGVDISKVYELIKIVNHFCFVYFKRGKEAYFTDDVQFEVRRKTNLPRQDKAKEWFARIFGDKATFQELIQRLGMVFARRKLEALKKHVMSYYKGFQFRERRVNSRYSELVAFETNEEVTEKGGVRVLLFRTTD